jgi:EmrB/QacA subfamily drug resistance transporter
MKALAIASAGAFVAALSTSLVAVSAPVIASDLGAAPSDVSWILTAYLLAISALLALAGKAADVLGPKRVYLAGYALFAAGSVACALAPSLRVLVASRVLQGVGAAMLMAIGPAIVTRTVRPERRARGLGVQLAATYVGLTVGPSIGGLLATTLGWHSVFAVVAVAAAISGGAAAIVLDADGKPEPQSGLDLVGGALFAVTLLALLLGLKRLQDRANGLWLFAVAALVLVVFVRHEHSVAAPVLPPSLFRSKAFTFGIIGATLLYTITFVLAWALPFHLQRTLGFDASRAGAFMTAQPAAMALAAPLSGMLADRWGPRVPSTLGMVVIATGLLGVSIANHDGRLVAALALIGVGAGLYVTPNSALVMGAAPRGQQAIAGAVMASARNVGMTLGVALAATLLHAAGFGTAIAVAAVLAAIGAVLGIVRPVVSPSS